MSTNRNASHLKLVRNAEATKPAAPRSSTCWCSTGVPGLDAVLRPMLDREGFNVSLPQEGAFLQTRGGRRSRGSQRGRQGKSQQSSGGRREAA